ncbi:hypothetical protein CVT26_014447, partial [Gymnopilus dilepis]
MSTKHLYASSDGLVLKSLRGAVALNPSLGLHEPSKTVFVLPSSTPTSASSASASSSFSTTPPTPSKPTPRRTAVISGGGSGHEPAHAGYTGRGMLAASVAGDIFASPSAKQVLCAVELAAFGGCTGAVSGSSSSSSSGAGGSAEGSVKREEQEQEQEPRDVLAIINNYTGDILNFGLAIEKARLLHPRLNIASVVVADDVALLRQTKESNSLVGPRGLGANVLVCKILGALAEYGPGPSYTSSSSTTSASTSGGSGARASLALLKAYGDAVTANLYSLGVGLDHCHVPGHGRPASSTAGGTDNARLRGGECEVGLGLHNEPGVQRRPIGSAEGLLEDMVRMLLDAQIVRSGAGMLRKGGGNGNREGDGEEEGCVLFVNNLGGMSQLEMGAVVHDVLEILGSHRPFPSLAKERIHPRRVYSSSYMTSLNAPGFSLSLLDAAGIRMSLDTLQSNITSTTATTPTSSSTTAQGSDSDSDPEQEQLKEDLAKIDLYSLLDAPTDATAWVGARRWDSVDPSDSAGERRRKGQEAAVGILASSRTSTSGAVPGGGGPAPQASTAPPSSSSASTPTLSGVVDAAIRGACTHVLNVRDELTEYDTLVGDGDCGDTFAAGANGLLQALDNHTLTTQNVELSKVVSQVADVLLEDRM